MKIEDALKDLQNSISYVAGKTVQLQARCDALEVAVRILGKRAGVSDDRISKMLHNTEALLHQKYLERLEDISPRLGAQADIRPPLADIPDDFV